MKLIRLCIFPIAPILAIFFLANCGGDRAQLPPVTPIESAIQGIFQGSTSNSTFLSEIVLEDGTFWGVYGMQADTTFSIQGVNTGRISSDNNSFSLSYTNFPVPGNTPVAASGSGTYTATSLAGTLTEDGKTQHFNLTAFPSTSYIFHTPALVSSITGAWSGNLLNGEISTINIASTGTFSGNSSDGCGYYGKFTPRPSGVNIFNVRITFRALPCTLPNQTESGIAVSYSLGNGTNALFIAAATPSLTASTAFYAER